MCPVIVQLTSSRTWAKNSLLPAGGLERGRRMARIWERVGYGIMIYTHPRVFNARSKTSRVEAQVLGREAWLELSIIETLIAKQVEADRPVRCP